MTDQILTLQQGQALLEKLASDDSFRTLYKTSPARALHALGIDAETIVLLPAKCLCACDDIAPKALYLELLKSCADEAITSTMKMSTPTVGFNQR